ncbi:Uncharacterised protein [Serratia liquefaciens]|nr:Uncharacterised protein [Serratia liquefaciens]
MPLALYSLPQAVVFELERYGAFTCGIHCLRLRARRLFRIFKLDRQRGGFLLRFLQLLTGNGELRACLAKPVNTGCLAIQFTQ